MQQLVTAQDLADTLNRLRLADPMWNEGGFRVSGRWLEIDPDLSDALAAQALRCDPDEARRRRSPSHAVRRQAGRRAVAQAACEHTGALVGHVSRLSQRRLTRRQLTVDPTRL